MNAAQKVAVLERLLARVQKNRPRSGAKPLAVRVEEAPSVRPLEESGRPIGRITAEYYLDGGQVKVSDAEAGSPQVPTANDAVPSTIPGLQQNIPPPAESEPGTMIGISHGLSPAAAESAPGTMIGMVPPTPEEIGAPNDAWAAGDDAAAYQDEALPEPPADDEPISEPPTSLARVPAGVYVAGDSMPAPEPDTAVALAVPESAVRDVSAPPVSAPSITAEPLDTEVELITNHPSPSEPPEAVTGDDVEVSVGVGEVELDAEDEGVTLTSDVVAQAALGLSTGTNQPLQSTAPLAEAGVSTAPQDLDLDGDVELVDDAEAIGVREGQVELPTAPNVTQLLGPRGALEPPDEVAVEPIVATGALVAPPDIANPVVTQPELPDAFDVATFTGPVPIQPSTFGEILDAALSL